MKFKFDSDVSYCSIKYHDFCHIYIYIYNMCVCVYIKRERERDIEVYIQIYMSMYFHIYHSCIYLLINYQQLWRGRLWEGSRAVQARDGDQGGGAVAGVWQRPVSTLVQRGHLQPASAAAPPTHLQVTHCQRTRLDHREANDTKNVVSSDKGNLPVASWGNCGREPSSDCCLHWIYDEIHYVSWFSSSVKANNQNIGFFLKRERKRRRDCDIEAKQVIWTMNVDLCIKYYI